MMLTKAHAEIECKQEDNIERLNQEMAKLNKTVFYGNGQPSIVAQLAVFARSMQVLSWLVGVTCVAVIGQIVSRIFVK